MVNDDKVPKKFIKNYSCEKYKDHLPSEEVETDLFVFVNFEADPGTGVLAWATICNWGVNGRATIALVNIYYNVYNYSKALQTIDTVLHELFHPMILGSAQLNEVLPSDQYQEISTGETVISSPKVIAELQDHLNCSTADKVFVENNGGGHFEETLFGNEVMTPVTTGIDAFSRVLMGLMEDSTWYQTNYCKAEKYQYGKDEGCDFYQDFLNKTCNHKYREFCYNKSSTCTRDYLSKASCFSTSYNECTIENPSYRYQCQNTKNFFKNISTEEPGAESRCFEASMGDWHTANCYPSRCANDTIYFDIWGSEYQCGKDSAGQTLSLFGGQLTITCPVYEEFCASLENKGCPNNCNANGKCLEDNTCYCSPLFEGVDCSIYKPCGGVLEPLCS